MQVQYPAAFARQVGGVGHRFATPTPRYKANIRTKTWPKTVAFPCFFRRFWPYVAHILSDFCSYVRLVCGGWGSCHTSEVVRSWYSAVQSSRRDIEGSPTSIFLMSMTAPAGSAISLRTLPDPPAPSGTIDMITHKHL